MTETSPTRKAQLQKAGPLIAAGLLVLVALFSFIAQCAFRHAPSEEAHWQRAAALTVELTQATDAVRVHPSWVEAPLPHLQPVGNLLHRHHRPLLEDFAHIERVLILTERRRIDEALARLPFPAERFEVHDFDSVALLVVDIPAEFQIQSRLSDDLSGARVYIGESETGLVGVSVCRDHTARDNSWQCAGRDASQMVRPILLEIENDPRRCIQAFPPPGERYLAVEMSVEEPKDVLRIRAGLDNRAARLEAGDDVVYRILLDNELKVERQISGHQSTWTPHDFDTAGLGGAVTVRLEVESVAEQPHHRRFCFNGWALTRLQAR